MSIHDLPPELLSKIISLAALFRPTRLPSYKHFLLDLCLVSKTWRDIAYANPVLWSFIDIVFTTNPITRKQNPSHLPLDPKLVDTVSTWLERSGEHPKTYTIWAPRNKRGGEDDCHAKQQSTGNDLLCPLSDPTLIKLLVKGPPAAKLAVTCPSSNCFRNLVRFLDIGYTFKWDHVKELMVDCWEGQQTWTDPTRSGVSMFRFFNSLTTLNLALPSDNFTYYTGWPPGSEEPTADKWKLPISLLQGLRVLSLSCDWEGPWVAHTLSNCTNLEELSIDFLSGPSHFWLRRPNWSTRLPALSSGGPAGHVVLPQLHTLRVRNINVTTGSWILHFLRTPSLNHLYASFITMYAEASPDPSDDEDEDDDEGNTDEEGSGDEATESGGGTVSYHIHVKKRNESPKYNTLTMPAISRFLHSFLTPPDQPVCSTLTSMEIGETPLKKNMDATVLSLDPGEFAEITSAFPALERFSSHWDESTESAQGSVFKPAVREEDPEFCPPLGCLEPWRHSIWYTRVDYERRGGIWERIPDVDVVSDLGKYDEDLKRQVEEKREEARRWAASLTVPQTYCSNCDVPAGSDSE